MNVKIEKLDHFGRGITEIDNKICFVENALPNEIVKINIIKETKKYYVAEVVDFIEKSPNRIIEKCPYYSIFCGGCDLEHLSFKKENEFFKKCIYHKAEIKMRRSNSQDSSLSNTSNIMDQIFNCDTKVEKRYYSDMGNIDEMKPILKKRNRNSTNSSEIRRVSFNKKVEFSY